MSALKAAYQKAMRSPEIGNIFWLVFDRIWRLLMSLVVGVWVTRFLGPDNFGKINYVLAFTGIATVVCNLGMESFLVKEIAGELADAGKILKSALILRLITGSISFLFLLLFFSFSGESSENIKMLYVLALPILTVGFATVDFVFQAELSSKVVVVCRNFFFIVGSLLKLLALYLKAPFYVFVVLTVFDVVLSDICLYFFYFLKKRVPARADRPYIAALFKKSIPFLLSNLAIVIYMKVDQILLGKLSSVAQVGYFSATTKVTEVFYFIPLVITGSIYGMLIKAKNIGPELYHKYLKYIFWGFIACAILLCFLLNGFSYWIITFLFGDSYTAAVPVLKVYCWTLVPVFAGVAFGQILVIEERSDIVLYKTLIGVVINVVLNVLLIPSLGAWGAAVATIVTQFVSAVAANLFFKESRKFFLNYFTSSVK